MQIEVRARDEDGEVLLEGRLNRNEVSFLLGWAINGLMHQGVLFDLQDQGEDGDKDDAPNRIIVPKDSLN